MVNFANTKDAFEKCLSENAIVAVDFTASWCGPCRFIGHKFEAMSEEDKFKGVITFIKVDVDENEEVAGSAGIRAMPTFKLYKGGKEVDELVGASEEKLRQMLEKALAE